MEVVKGVYLGTYFDAINCDLLRRLGITHIVNASCLPVHHLKVLEVPVSDNPDSNIKKYFGRVSKFIVSGLLRGNVMVNCHMATSRSPTLVIAFLIKKRKMTLEDAHALVRKVNRKVDINPGFWEQLVSLN